MYLSCHSLHHEPVIGPSSQEVYLHHEIQLQRCLSNIGSLRQGSTAVHRSPTDGCLHSSPADVWRIAKSTFVASLLGNDDGSSQRNRQLLGLQAQDDRKSLTTKSSHKNSDDNKYESKECDDDELATKEDNNNDKDGVESESEDNELSSDEDKEEETEEEWLSPIDKKSKKRKHFIASHQPTKAGIALGTDFSLHGGLSSLDTIPQQYKFLLDTSSPETKAIFDTWSHSVPFQWLACRYFGQSWDMVRIISEELGYTVAEYLNFRGWGFHHSQKNNQPCLRYHRFEMCMQEMQEQVEVNKGGALSRHFTSMISSLFHVLKDTHRRVPSSIPRTFEDDFWTPARFGEKVNNQVQIYHLCYTVIILVFKRAALVKKIVMETLVENMFGKLWSQREIYGTLGTLL